MVIFVGPPHGNHQRSLGNILNRCRRQVFVPLLDVAVCYSAIQALKASLRKVP
jgi:hypothetical protein